MADRNRREFMKTTGAAALSAGLYHKSTSGNENAMTTAKEIIADHESRLKPLEISSGQAWWTANVTGKDSDFAAKEKAQNLLDAALSDPVRFARIKSVREAGVADPSEKRQIELLYLQALEKQVDPKLLEKITARANAIEKAFNVFRAKVGGKELSDSQVREILKSSKASDDRKATWEGSKGVGVAVEADLKELVKLRNESAKSLGFSDYHVMMLSLNEQSQA